MRTVPARCANHCDRGLRTSVRLMAMAFLAVGLFGSLSTASRPTAGAQVGGGTALFDLSARADALGIELIGTGLPVVPEGKVAFVSPGSAQATLNQFAGSSFASAPFGGELIASLPSTVNGLGAGSLPPVPAYPFYVSADSSTPSDREEVGPYLIDAQAGPNSSTAEARIGLSTFSPQVMSITAQSEVTRNPDSGELRATATTRTAPLRVNDLLSIGEIHSSATFRFDPSEPDATPVKESSLSVGTVTIAGIELGITEDGLTLAGQQLAPVNVSALSSLLADSGFEIEVIPIEETETSITSSAVQITFQEELPAPFLDTTVRMILGRSSATLTTSSLDDLAAGDDESDLTPTLPPSDPSERAPATTPVDTGSIADSSAPPPVTPGDAGSPPTSSPAPASDNRMLVAAPLADFARFYPILAGGALLALASSRLVQWLTFRLRLTPS